VVRRRTRDRKIASSNSGRCIAGYIAKVNSAFHPSGVGKWSTSLLARIKAGRVHLCRVAGNTVWSHMASDVPWLWDGNPLTAIRSFTFTCSIMTMRAESLIRVNSLTFNCVSVTYYRHYSCIFRSSTWSCNFRSSIFWSSIFRSRIFHLLAWPQILSCIFQSCIFSPPVQLQENMNGWRV